MARNAELKARIQLAGGPEFRRELARLGDRGQKAFQALDRAAKSNRGALRKLDGAAATVRKGLRKLQGNLGGLNPSIGQLTRGIGRLSRRAGLLAGTAIAGAVTGVGVLATRSAAAADEVGKMSQALGISAAALQEYRFAAEQSGATQRDFDDSVRRFTRRLGQFATDGSGAAADSFERLGVKVRDARGQIRPTELVLDDIVRELGKLDSEAEIAALASDFFGERAGPKLVPLLKQGETGIKNLRQEARDLGKVFSEEQTQASADYQDAINRVQTAISGVANQIGQVFLPKLTTLTDRATAFLVNNRAQIVDYAEQGWAYVIQVVEDFLALFRDGGQAQVALAWTKSVYDGVGDLIDQISALRPQAEAVFDYMARRLRDVRVLVNSLRVAYDQLFGDGNLVMFEDGRTMRLNQPTDRSGRSFMRVGPNGDILSRAEGGPVHGPGTATSDSIPARLSAGEYVIRAAAVRQVGQAFLDRLNGLGAGALTPGFADGGMVAAAATSAPAPVTNHTRLDFSGATIQALNPEGFIDSINAYVRRGGGKRIDTSALAPRGVRR